jgi:hypothetical protein
MEPSIFFAKIASLIVNSARYLTIIIEAGLGNADAATAPLPSWVPNYVSKSRYSAFITRTAEGLNAGLVSLNQKSFYINGTNLHCQGNDFDVVDEAWDLGPLPFELDLLQLCTNFSVNINGRPRLEVFWRTLILDETHDGTTPAPVDYGLRFMAMIASSDGPKLSNLQRRGVSTDDYFSRFGAYLEELNVREVLGNEAVATDEIRQYADAYTQNSIDNPDARGPFPENMIAIDRMSFPYFRSRDASIAQDRLYRTRGGLMGVCRGPCQMGDEVWALRDAHVPFVLRRSSGSVCFQLIGACFVLDLMQGEMVSGDVADITIV